MDCSLRATLVVCQSRPRVARLPDQASRREVALVAWFRSQTVLLIAAGAFAIPLLRPNSGPQEIAAERRFGIAQQVRQIRPRPGKSPRWYFARARL